MKAKQVKENFPDSIIGNDNIIWKKMRENSTIVNYEPFWRGYSLSPGGFNVASMKELNDIISQFILSIDNYNRLKFRKPKDIDEGYGAGFSFTGGAVKGMGGTSRGGFGGANNLGGPNMMYTYEVKPLNHTLEQKPTDVADQVPKVQIGSKVSGIPFRSNATPSPKRISGIIKKIVKTEDNSIKYYIIQNELTQNLVKIDPLTTSLIIHEPVEYYFDATDNIPSRRKQKIKDATKEHKYVPESLSEMVNEADARGQKILNTGSTVLPTYYGISEDFENSKWAKILNEAGIKYEITHNGVGSFKTIVKVFWKSKEEAKIVKNIVFKMMKRLWGNRGWAEEYMKLDWNPDFYGHEKEA